MDLLEKIIKTPISEKDLKSYQDENAIEELISDKLVKYIHQNYKKELTNKNLQLISKRGGWLGDIADAGLLFIGGGYSNIIKHVLNKNTKRFLRLACLRLISDVKVDSAIDTLIELIDCRDHSIHSISIFTLNYYFKKELLSNNIKRLLLMSKLIKLINIDKYEKKRWPLDCRAEAIELLGSICNNQDIKVIEFLNTIKKKRI